MSRILKSVIQDIINDNTESAQVSMHSYLVAKTQEVSGLKQLDETQGGKDLKLFHSSSETFNVFIDQPTWFALSKHDARGWHKNGHDSYGKQHTYICEYTGGKIATEEEAEEAAQQIWPDDDFIYSMHDQNVGEFEKEDVQAFHAILEKEGYNAAYLQDYDPRDSDKDSRTLVVFHPNKTIKIVGEETFTK